MSDIEKIVDTLAEMNLLRPVKISGDWYQCYCPFHNGGNEKRPSFGILLHDQYKNGVYYKAGMGHCFACSFNGSIIDIVNRLLKEHSISQSGQDWLKENVPGFETESEFDYLIPKDMMEKLENSYALDYINSHSIDSTKEYVSDKELSSYRYTVPYMYERRLTDDVINKYDVGVDLNWIPPGRKQPVPCITFPVRDHTGGTLFFCRRSIKGKIYNYPEGVTKPVYGLYELPKNCESVIICESCINALTAVVYGYNAVALMGTGNSYQIDQLKKLGVYEYVICTDGDEAGRRAANKLKKALQNVAIVWTIEMPEGKDLNDFDAETFKELYKNKI